MGTLRLLAAIALSLVIAVLTACDGSAAPSQEEEILRQNRERFRASVGTSYAYDYQNVCFCLVDVTRRVRVSVRDGARVSVVDVESGEPLPPERFGEFLTVEEIFDVIQQAFDDGAASIRAQYDETLGYPRDVYIDFDERLADEERGFVVENLIVE